MFPVSGKKARILLLAYVALLWVFSQESYSQELFSQELFSKESYSKESYSKGSISPRLEPSSTAKRFASLEEPLGLQDFIDASLMFSIVGEKYADRGRDKMKALIENLKTETASISDPLSLAEEILIYMHRTVLRVYREQVTELDALLEKGEYNCVSSAVLYAILCRSLGLTVKGVRTKDHAFCLLRLDNKSYDVETTNIYGFNPGEKKEFFDQFGKITGFSYVPPSHYGNRTETGDLGLLALILQNRSSLLTRQGDYIEAVGPAVDAYTLVSDNDGFDKLMLVFVNAASWYNVNNLYEMGISFIDAAATAYGRDARLGKAKGDLLHNWIVQRIETGDLNEAKRMINRYFKSGNLPQTEQRDLLIYIYQIEAKALAGDQGNLAAYSHIQAGVDELGSDNRLLKSRGVYKYNFEVEVHNAAVTAYNAKDYVGAKRILEAALSKLSGSERLKTDLELVEKMLSE